MPAGKTATPTTTVAAQPSGDVPLFESIDTTGAGKVDFSQVKVAFSGVTQDLFDAHDFDGNGTLDATEYEGMKAELAAL